MGFAISWCAVREEQGEAFLGDLGLARTGRQMSGPDAAVSMRTLASRWRLMLFNEFEPRQITESSLTTLSANRELLVCAVEEHVMVSSSELWSGGSRQWQIYHDGDERADELDVIGSPPASLAGIRAEVEKLQHDEGDQSNVDYLFDIPVLVAENVVGYRHDEDLVPGVVWEEVDHPKGGGFFSRLFGK